MTEVSEKASLFKHNHCLQLVFENRLAYSNFSVNFPMNISAKFYRTDSISLIIDWSLSRIKKRKKSQSLNWSEPEEAKEHRPCCHCSHCCRRHCCHCRRRHGHRDVSHRNERERNEKLQRTFFSSIFAFLDTPTFSPTTTTQNAIFLIIFNRPLPQFPPTW